MKHGRHTYLCKLQKVCIAAKRLQFSIAEVQTPARGTFAYLVKCVAAMVSLIQEGDCLVFVSRSATATGSAMLLLQLVGCSDAAALTIRLAFASTDSQAMLHYMHMSCKHCFVTRCVQNYARCLAPVQPNAALLWYSAITTTSKSCERRRSVWQNLRSVSALSISTHEQCSSVRLCELEPQLQLAKFEFVVQVAISLSRLDLAMYPVVLL